MASQIPLFKVHSRRHDEIPEIIGYATVDDDDFERLNEHRWCLFTSGRNLCGYARRMIWKNGKRYELRMHNVVMGEPPEGHVWDHINHDGLDNRKENLRLATDQQNKANRKIQKNNTTGFKGVRKKSNESTFGAYIGSGQTGEKRSQIYLGRYRDPIDAARAYNIASKIRYGEFAVVNPVPEDPEEDKRIRDIVHYWLKKRGVQL